MAASVDESPRSSDDRFFTPRLSARTGGYASSEGDDAAYGTPRGRESERSQSESDVSCLRLQRGACGPRRARQRRRHPNTPLWSPP